MVTQKLTPDFHFGEAMSLEKVRWDEFDKMHVVKTA